MVEGENGVFMIDPSMVDIVPIENIKPYQNNAKKHPQEQIDKIINSIKAFGMNDPVGVWGSENIIVEGHGRYIAMKEIGEKHIPVIHLDALTDEQRRAYTLTHNKTAELSGWNFEVLESEIDKLSDYFDMSDFGFFENNADIDSLDDLFAPAEEKEKEPKQIQCPHCGEWFVP